MPTEDLRAAAPSRVAAEPAGPAAWRVGRGLSEVCGVLAGPYPLPACCSRCSRPSAACAWPSACACPCSCPCCSCSSCSGFDADAVSPNAAGAAGAAALAPRHALPAAAPSCWPLRACSRAPVVSRSLPMRLCVAASSEQARSCSAHACSSSPRLCRHWDSWRQRLALRRAVLLLLLLTGGGSSSSPSTCAASAHGAGE
jgi:hypothetical protein